MERTSQSPPIGRGVLRRTQLAVLLLIFALALVGRREFHWPIVTWPVYSTARFPFPAANRSILELRVTTGQR